MLVFIILMVILFILLNLLLHIILYESKTTWDKINKEYIKKRRGHGKIIR
jgi:uncharacterized protein HemY